MSQNMRWVILVLLVGSCALTGCGQEEVVVEAEMTPAQVKDQEMSDAAYYGMFVVQFEMDTNGKQYAICNGSTRIVGLDEGETRRVKLTSQEALNATLCRRNAGTGNYSGVQNIGGVGPGDYLTWDSNGVLGLTRYNGN